MHIAFISKLSLQEREPQLKTKINTKKKGNLNYKQTDNWIKGPFNLRGGEGGGGGVLPTCLVVTIKERLWYFVCLWDGFLLLVDMDAN